MLKLTPLSLVSAKFDAYNGCNGVWGKDFTILDIIAFIRSYNKNMAGSGYEITVVNVISEQSIKNLSLAHVTIDEKIQLNKTPMSFHINAFISTSQLLPKVREISKLFNHYVSRNILDDKGFIIHTCIEQENQAFGVVQFKGSMCDPDFKGPFKINKTFSIIVGDPEGSRNKERDGEFCFGLKVI